MKVYLVMHRVCDSNDAMFEADNVVFASTDDRTTEYQLSAFCVNAGDDDFYYMVCSGEV